MRKVKFLQKYTLKRNSSLRTRKYLSFGRSLRRSLGLLLWTSGLWAACRVVQSSEQGGSGRAFGTRSFVRSLSGSQVSEQKELKQMPQSLTQNLI